jgi:hypothetical protein
LQSLLNRKRPAPFLWHSFQAVHFGFRSAGVSPALLRFSRTSAVGAA